MSQEGVEQGRSTERKEIEGALEEMESAEEGINNHEALRESTGPQLFV